MAENSIFDVLYPVDIKGKTEKKNGLTYLSWAWAWAEVKKRYPTANYEIHENEQGWNYFTDGRTCWVKVTVEIDGLRHTEHLPVMDYRNQSIPAEKVTSMDVCKSQQRCLTKCIARFGLGLNLYIGEDMPDEDRSLTAQKASRTAKKEQEVKQPIMDIPDDFCTICRLPVMDYNGKKKNGEPVEYKKQDIIAKSIEMYGSPVCMACMLKKAKAEKGGKA